MRRAFLLILFLSILTGCSNKEVKKENQIIKNNEMLSYTLDGEATQEQPNKDSGFIVNKIECKKGSIIVWDNDNWQVELVDVKGADRCTVDFTKDTTKEGYRVIVTSNLTSALDSLSKATTLNGTVIIYSTSKIESVTGCDGVIEDNKVIVNNVNFNKTCNIKIELKTLGDAIKISYPPQPGRTDFSVIDDGTPALYTGKDDQGTTYYFSGDGTNMNNWVSFANKMWRIIRINGNGSIRLLYSGDGNDATDIGRIAFNSSYHHPAYAGWKYTYNENSTSVNIDRGNEIESPIYTYINNNWYSKLSPIDKNYIDTNAIYCNDRSLAKDNKYNISNNFKYIAYERLITENGTPTFMCNNAQDKFQDGFGLMTADEIVAAGGLYGTNNPKAYCFLKASGTGSITGVYFWWTMSPHDYYGILSFTGANMFSAGGDLPGGQLASSRVSDSEVVRPVVSIKYNTLVSGLGTPNDPYILHELQ